MAFIYQRNEVDVPSIWGETKLPSYKKKKRKCWKASKINLFPAKDGQSFPIWYLGMEPVGRVSSSCPPNSKIKVISGPWVILKAHLLKQ